MGRFDFIPKPVKGILDRTGKVLQGAGDVLTFAPELVYDLANGALTDADFKLIGSIQKELGEAGAGLIGPDRGVGALIGGAPEAVRAPVRSAIDASLVMTAPPSPSAPRFLVG